MLRTVALLALVAGASATCYSDATTIVPNCECHSSCETCGYNSMPTGENDCITCASSGDNLHAVYTDGTGSCSAYQTAEIFCTHGYNSVTCGEIETETSCSANTECVWDANWTYCDLNAADRTLLYTDLNRAGSVAFASTAGAACRAITTDTACTEATACVWSPQEGECWPTFATAKTALDAASVPASAQAFYEVYTYDVTTCGPANVSATTCSDSNCEIWTPHASAQQGIASSCDLTPSYILKIASAYCGTNGAAALATAQAAAGLSSGANSAAPAMVIISALVGALAIFA